MENIEHQGSSAEGFEAHPSFLGENISRIAGVAVRNYMEKGGSPEAYKEELRLAQEEGERLAEKVAADIQGSDAEARGRAMESLKKLIGSSMQTNMNRWKDIEENPETKGMLRWIGETKKEGV